MGHNEAPRPTGGEKEALARLHAAVKESRGAAPDLPRGADYVDELRAAEAERQRVHDSHG